MVITKSTSALCHNNSGASDTGDSPYIDSRSASSNKFDVDAIAADDADIKSVASKYAKFLQCCDASTSDAVGKAQVLLDETFDRNAEIVTTSGDSDDSEFIKYTTGANAALATAGYRYRMRPSPCLFMLRRTKNAHVEVVGVKTIRVSYDVVAEGWDDTHVQRIVTVREGKIVHSRPVDNDEDTFQADKE